MATAQALLSAVMSPAGTKIVVRGSRPEFADFFGSLPGARWMPSDYCWTCDPTPACAARIVSNDLASVEADQAVARLACDFQNSTRKALLATLGGDLAQPAVRRNDSWQHQLRAYHFADALDASLLYMDPGTGKSKVAVDLAINQRDETTLIMCPVSVMGVWRREFAKHADGWENNVFVADTRWPVARRAKEAGAFLARQKRTGRPAAVVVNYDSVWRAEFGGGLVLDQMWDRVIADEGHRLKSPTSAVSKFAAKLYKRSGRRQDLTGTPLANGPLDAFGQYRFLDPGIFGTSWHRFSNEFAVMSEMFHGQVLRYRNQDEFAKRFGLIAYRVEADVLGLPDVTHTIVPVSLGAKAAKVYRELEREMIAEVKEGVVTVSNALVKLIRLQQATSGFTALDDTKEVVDLGDDKAIALRDLVSDFGLNATGQDGSSPVVVFCRFRHDLDRVAAVAAQLNLRYGELSGRKHDLTDHASMPDWVDLMGVQYQSGGVGIDLTRSHYAVYYSNTWSLAEFDQSIARLNRPGQSRPVSCWHLSAAGTVDVQMAEAVEAKREIVDDVLRRMKEAA